MEKRSKELIMALVVLGTYLLMVVVNALANIIPINGQGTGVVSDSYFNLFAPIGLTFAIWGVIYVLLLGFSLYQLFKRSVYLDRKDYKIIGGVFTISSIINTVWIFAWHYNQILLSLVLMIGILVSLIVINMTIRKMTLSPVELVLVKAPFSVYFGWITIATIANVTTFLVSIDWNGFGISEVLWTNIMIFIGAVIGALAIRFYKSYVYGLVFVWAYFGIALKHASSDFFDLEYPSVIVVVFISILLICLAEVYLGVTQRQKRREQSDELEVETFSE